MDFIRVPVKDMEEANEMWDSGVCRGTGFRDPAGNAILLHDRYARYPDGSMP